MKAQRPGNNPLRQHYDKLALVVVLLVLVASAGVLVLRVSGQKKVLESGASLATGNGLKATGLDTSNYNQRVEAIRNPFSVPPGSQRMAVGELRVACVKDGKPIPFDALVCPFCSAEQPPIDDKGLDSDGDGIPDGKEREMGLNYADPNDARLDPDGDRYNNLDEFKAGTVHTNAASVPPPHTKLRLVNVKVDAFRMRFVSMQTGADGKPVFQLNLRSLERTYLKRIGQEAEGWTLDNFDPKDPEGPTLFLKKGDVVRRLVQGKVISEDAKTAILVWLLEPRKTFSAKKDEAFKLQDRAYKVVDIGDMRVVIRDESTQSEITVERPTEADRLFLQGMGGEPVAVPGQGPGGAVVRP